MNKKFLFGGLVAVAAFAILSAFGGQTLEQQKQEIASAITAQLDEFRAQKQQECTDRVNAEAQTRYDAYVAALPPAKPEAKPQPAKSKKTVKAPVKDPLPQKAPDQGVDRPGATKRDAAPAPVERPGATKREETPSAPPAPVERPGATKRKEGGK